MPTAEQIEERNKQRAILAQKIPQIINRQAGDYQKDIGVNNNTQFLRYNQSANYNLKSQKIITPLSDDNIHFHYQITLGDNFDKLNTFDIDSFYGHMYVNISENIIVIPVIPDKTNQSESGFLHFQSSKMECGEMAGKIAKALSGVNNDILKECIISGTQNQLGVELGCSNPNVKFLDWNKLYKLNPEVVKYIFSFCQSQTYAQEFFKIYKIDYQQVKSEPFIKPNKQKQTTLNELLKKHDVKGENHRAQLSLERRANSLGLSMKV